MFLGDSFTYGIGVDDDQTFCYLTEKRLSAMGLNAEVINAGNSGTGTDYALKFFNTLGYKFKPDIVALCFSSGDFSDNLNSKYYTVKEDGKLVPKSFSNSISAKKEILKVLPFYNWLISWSHVANLFKQTIVKFIYQREAKLANKMGYSDEYNKKLTAIFITYLKINVEHTGTHLVVFYMPFVKEVLLYREKYLFSDEERAVTEIFQSQDISFLSLTPILAKQKMPIL